MRAPPGSGAIWPARPSSTTIHGTWSSESAAGVEAEAEEVRIGLAAVRLELAQMAQARGDLREARVHIQDVLRVDPSNARALEMRAPTKSAWPKCAAR
jgi:Tfp pilus assembly protein PilF